ncbi:trypsin-like peptidase domain-containing protein [Actinophytocola sp.]|uniref:nSTAND1 domain-containing NTPase n=1 Tax=Actinophytocola sp. TaxID=1872138 RepID=UPI002DDD114D|nr:trypsin-like peptidase domain-containing protein [Actinophytocola sp.]
MVGTGFLATGELVLTCAHVLGTEGPDGPVMVDFPLLAGDTRATAHVVAWHGIEPDGRGDIAVLRLAATPSVAVPSRLSDTTTRWGEQVRVFGFPPDLGSDYGVWVEAELRAANGAGWLQIESAPGRRPVGPGFSGSPVFAPSSGGVVGMVVAAERGAHTTTSYVLPVGALLAAHPEIAAPDPGEICPYRGLEPFYEEHAEWFRGRESLAERLLDLVGTRPIVVVAGPSGSGKSSLVRAGLVPAVRRRRMDVAVFRLLPGEPALTSFARALLPVLEPELTEQARLVEAESLAARLSTARAQTLPWLTDRLLSNAKPGGLLIVMDQFEEGSADRSSETRELFELVLDLAGAARRHRDGSPALAVVLTLRSGALDELVTDRTADAVAGGVVFVPPMTRAQLAEAISPGGVAFEPGLVARILDDAGTEPGTLPLVEFALARLWDNRSAGTLTHGAYDELDGVAGALAGYAEGLYGRLTPAEQESARRLLVGLARPDDDGGFLRRPLLLSDVDDELFPVLGKLSTGRLVVVGRTATGTEIVELAHQALLDRWPRLGEWLAEERDFLSWREQLRGGMSRWLADNRDPGGLLRGAALARAEEWLAGDADLSTEEREYIRASQARERRRHRVLLGVIAVITILALVAGGLAVLAQRANNRAQDQLRLAHSRALAEDSLRFRTINPRMALQLALAAWNTAPTSEAYGALFTQYAGLQSVEKVVQDPWHNGLDRIMTSPDGSVAAFVNKDGLPSVWTGLNGDDPHRDVMAPLPHRVPGGTFQLSPSGKLLGYTSAIGHVVLWDLQRHSPAVMLRDTTQPSRIVRSMAFSSDETKLLIQRSQYESANPEFELWDLEQHRTVPIAQRLGPDRATEIMFFGPTPNTVVLDTPGSGANIYDLTTGQLMRAVPKPNPNSDKIAQNGAALVHCATGGDPSPGSGYRESLDVLDLATGTRQRSIPVPSCYGFELDTSTNYAIVREYSDEADANRQFTVTDLRTGRTYRLATPTMDLNTTGIGPDQFQDKIAMFAGADGHPVVLIGNKNLLYRQRPSRLDQSAAAAATSEVTNRQGDLGVTFDPSGAINLINLETNATVATAPGSIPCWGTCGRGKPLDFSPDGKRLLVVRDDTLVIYAVPALTIEARISLPLPPTLGGPPNEDGYEADQWSSSVGILNNDQVTVLHAGMITRWNPNDGRQIGTPIQVRTDRDALRRSAHLAVLEPRPQHPAEAVVIEPNGDAELWNLDQHRTIATLDRSNVSQGSVRFNPKGSIAAVHTPDRDVQLWDIEPTRKRGRPIPTGGTGVLGFTPDNKLITIDLATNKVAHIWDQDTGKRLATLTGPTSYAARWTLEDDRLTVFGKDETRSIELDPNLWLGALCQLSNWDFTDDERAVLAQLGAPQERPCP